MYPRAQTLENDFAQLICGRGSYGEGSHRTPAQRSRRRAAVTMTADTGTEVVAQPGIDTTPPDFTEYVVDREPLLPLPASPPTTASPTPAANALIAPAPPPAPPGAPPATVESPIAPTPSLTSAGAAPAGQPPAVAIPAPAAPPDEPRPQQPAAVPQTPATSATAIPAALAQSPLTSAELAADLQAILGGPRPDTAPPQPPSPIAPTATAPPMAEPAAAARPMADVPDEHSIFDAIALSMEHANKFDLGIMPLQQQALQQRLDRFDHADDARRAQRPTPAATTAPMSTPPQPSSSNNPPVPDTIPARAFYEVYDQDGPWSRLPGRTAACGLSGLALSLAPQRSIPMFDTGEHVLAAGDLYVDQLRVGRDGSVLLSYGQVVAMPDLYANVEDLRMADPAEVRHLKSLIARNTAYYRDGKVNQADDVSSEEWEEATSKRYLALAADNYAHFSPPSVLGMSFPTTKSDNRARYIEYHSRAAHEMRALLQANPDSPQPTSAITTNAFGDHFLTDAFAAGHLINKEVVLDGFKRNFFTGAHLNDAAKAFFQRVAEKSFHGKVADEMSKLETTNYPVCVWGFCLPWHPNINSADRFTEVLRRAAEAEPDKIGNLAVKAVHDHLNKVGVPVGNDAGDPEWTLYGDSHMDATTLGIMRRAVQQSVNNMLDPAILAPTLDMLPLIERVFAHLPKVTPAGLAQVNQAIATYTDPTSQALIDTAATLIKDQIDSLISMLLASTKLKPA